MRYKNLFILIFLLGALYFLLYSAGFKINFTEDFCLKNSHCTLAVDMRNTSCRCPEVVSKNAFKTSHWVKYEEQKDYNEDFPPAVDCFCVPYDSKIIGCRLFNCSAY